MTTPTRARPLLPPRLDRLKIFVGAPPDVKLKALFIERLPAILGGSASLIGTLAGVYKLLH
jgi:hypothetical protein